MKKLVFLCCCLLSLAFLVSGCRIKLIQLNKRLERWQSLKMKASAEEKARFANKSLDFFLTTLDFQRGRETLVSESERLTYHARMCDMQVFLIDYYAGRALSLLTPEGREDWEGAGREWARADSLTRGRIPGVTSPYTMVLLHSGYEQYLKEISAQGYRYERMERDFPGLMAAFRKMSRYQFKLGEKFDREGIHSEAVKHYLLVFKRDPENFPRAERRVKFITGGSIREIYDQQYNRRIALETFRTARLDLYGMADQAIKSANEEFSPDSAAAMMQDIMRYISENFNYSVAQTTDIYLYTKNELDGTLPEYLNLWRYQVLRGEEPVKPYYVE